MRALKFDANAELARAGTVRLTHASERPLALHIVRFPEVLEIAIAELAPHRLTEYLYELSEVFNSFYRDCKVRHACVLACSRAAGLCASSAAVS